jgi:hypothetical protein
MTERRAVEKEVSPQSGYSIHKSCCTNAILMIHSAPQMTKDQRDARIFLQQAELAENNGDIKEATKFYKKAYRLDPSLDR